MKSKFLYPTKKNFIIFIMLYQIVPILVFNLAKFSMEKLFHLEFIGVAILGLWPLKPQEQKDEREIFVELKWKSIMLEGALIFVLIPLLFLVKNPAIEGWDVFRLYTYPLFIFLVAASLLHKKDLGYFNQ